jgi:hypothetical protein
MRQHLVALVIALAGALPAACAHNTHYTVRGTEEQSAAAEPSDFVLVSKHVVLEREGVAASDL